MKLKGRIIGFKGGGSQTTVTESGVPDWLRPDVQKAFGEATKAYDRGDLSNVASFAPGQTEFLSDVANQGIEGETARLLQNVQGNQLAQGQGTLGSARADRARQAGLADVAAQQAAQNLQAKNQAYDTIQQQKQLQLDAGHQGLQRLFGYYGSGAAGQSSSSTAPKSGGK